MDFQSAGHIVFPGLTLPPRSLIGLQEQIEVVGEYESDRSLHGTLIVYRPAWQKPLVKITLSASSDKLVPLPLDEFAPGTELIYYAGEWSTKTIQVGSVSTTLSHDPVPGSVLGGDPRVLNPTLFALAVAGRIVSIPAPADEPLTVYFRKQYEVAVVNPYGSRAFKRFEKSARSYSLVLEERGPA